VEQVEYTFAGPDDARTYLREVGRLWTVWVVGLVAVLLAHGLPLLFLSVGLIAVLILLARPLLPRTEALVPLNSREGGAVESALRGGTTRDRVLRELAYGTAPLEAALRMAGLSPKWVAARHVVVATTLLGFVYVIVVPLF